MTRVAICTDDSDGLGHVLQSLAIAKGLSRLRPRPAVLVLNSSAEAARLPRPEGCDLLHLPGPARGQARDSAVHLHRRATRKVWALPAQIAHTALTAFSPDLLVVNRHPRELGHELEGALTSLAGSTLCVLGLPDVLDSRVAPAGEWATESAAEALDTWFDAVWVYGDRRIHDVTAGLELPQRLRAAAAFTGYLTQRTAPVAPGRPGVLLGLAGGGVEGAHVARSFIAAAALLGHRSELVLGAELPARERAGLHATAAGVPDLLVHDAVPDLGVLLDRAGAVICMGGYCTVCEVLGSGLPALVVPRTWPGEEQLVRVSALAQRGRVSMVQPGSLNAEEVAAWAVGALRGAATPGVIGEVALDGVATVSALARRLLRDRTCRDAGTPGRVATTT
jgi:predicted glycosyltransferase